LLHRIVGRMAERELRMFTNVTFVRLNNDERELNASLRGANVVYSVGWNGHFVGYVADTGYSGTWKWQGFSRLQSVIVEATTRRDAGITLAREFQKVLDSR
jgi:hypothetical protein